MNKQYLSIIDKNLATHILEDLFNSNNLGETAKKFSCNIDALCCNVTRWDGCSDSLQNLDDYYYFYYKLEGRRCEICDISALESYDMEEYNMKIRTPEKEELNKILDEYNNSKMTLYELADKYNIVIYNLFRLLKEYKLIENESDAIGYEEFYKIYIGDYDYNKYDIKTDLGVIDIYYNFLIK